MFRGVFPYLAAAVVSLVAASVPMVGAHADVVRLDNGDRITGKPVHFENDRLVFDPAYGARLSVARAHVAALATNGFVTVRFADGHDATGQLLVTDLAQMRLAGAASAPSEFGPARVAAIYPGRKDLRHQFVWTGNVELGLTRTRGNSDADEMHLTGEAEGRSDLRRITVRGEYNRKVDQGATAVDNALIEGKYDRFVSKKLYFYTNASAMRDRLAGVDLRATVGTGAGYQIFDSADTKLSVEAGPSYIQEILKGDGAPDQIAARWAIRFSQTVVPDLARLFHIQEGYIDARDTGNLLLRTRTGFRFPMAHGLHATAELDFDLDTRPAPGKDETDRTYLLTVGYGW